MRLPGYTVQRDFVGAVLAPVYSLSADGRGRGRKRNELRACDRARKVERVKLAGVWTRWARGKYYHSVQVWLSMDKKGKASSPAGF